MENITEFQNLLAQPKKVVIVTHFKPDADALGSSLGLAGFLEKKGHQVRVITPSDYPEFLTWMPGNPKVLAVIKGKLETQQEAESLIGNADIVFCLDFSSLDRIETLEVPVKNSKAIKVLIDHHLEPENFAQYNQWTVKSASTAGLVLELIEQLGETHLIDSDTANCLYAGLMTDTGGFRHNNTKEQEFSIASRLVRMGANPHAVAKRIYDTNSLQRLQLIGYALYNKLTVLPEYRTAYMCITHNELQKFGTQTGDTEGLVNYGLSIKNMKLSVLMYDRNGEIKISLRSLNDFSVNDMARKHFNGGGHKNAAGGSSSEPLEVTLQRFLDILPEYKTELLKT